MNRYLYVTQVARVILGCTLFGTAVASGQPASEQDLADLQAYQVMMDSRPSAQHARVVQDMVSDARSRYMAGQSGTDAILSQAGSWARALGEEELAILCWEMMVASPESSAGEFSARRMLGVMMMRLADHSRAITEFSAAMEIAQEDNDLAKKYHRSLTQVVQELSGLLEREGDFQAAIACREALLHPSLRGVINPDIRYWVMRSNARMLAKNGFTDEADGWFQRCKEDIASDGGDTGLLIRVELERIRAIQSTREELENRLELLWNDPEFMDNPEIGSVGFALARSYREHGPEWEEMGFLVYQEIADRMIALVDTEEVQLLDAQQQVVLRHLEVALRYMVVLGEFVGKYEDAKLATITYMNRFALTDQTAFIGKAAERLDAKLLQKTWRESSE